MQIDFKKHSIFLALLITMTHSNLIKSDANDRQDALATFKEMSQYQQERILVGKLDHSLKLLQKLPRSSTDSSQLSKLNISTPLNTYNKQLKKNIIDDYNKLALLLKLKSISTLSSADIEKIRQVLEVYNDYLEKYHKYQHIEFSDPEIDIQTLDQVLQAAYGEHFLAQHAYCRHVQAGLALSENDKGKILNDYNKLMEKLKYPKAQTFDDITKQKLYSTMLTHLLVKYANTKFRKSLIDDLISKIIQDWDGLYDPFNKDNSGYRHFYRGDCERLNKVIIDINKIRKIINVSLIDTFDAECPLLDYLEDRTNPRCFKYGFNYYFLDKWVQALKKYQYHSYRSSQNLYLNDRLEQRLFKTEL